MKVNGILFAGLAMLMAAPSLSAAEPETVPLIERAKLFGNPSRVAGQISPDGKWVSWIAPKDGVLNVWAAPAADPTRARVLTNEKKRPIGWYFWMPDSTGVLYVNDTGGDENYKLYSADVRTGALNTLTPFDKTRVQILAVSNKVRDRILIGLNNRAPQWHDVYSLDLKSHKLTEILKNTGGFAGFIADETLNLRIAEKMRPDGGMDYYRVADNRVANEPFSDVDPDDTMTTGPAGFTADGKTLYWRDSRGRNTAALMAQDTASGKMRLIGESAKADVGATLRDPATGVVQAYAVNYLKTKWTALDPAIGKDLAYLRSKLKGEVHIASRTEADDIWIVADEPVTAPSSAYVYNRKAQTLTRFYTTRPELIGAPLVAMHPVEIKTRDGLTEVSYLTLPPGSDPDGDGVPDHAVPMVLLVHGGPWGRDGYGYNGSHQWLANRGYAVLSVNYRGSTGFGKAFINAGNLEWAGKMHDDLIDAVNWAIAHKIAQKDKVAIMGGSYGGYATLVGLTFTPKVFACGVDIVGPSNLITLLKTIPPYWKSMIAVFHTRMGDATTEAGRRLLHDRSPLFKADKIEKPLLIGQGANDPRVNKAEADQIVAAMKAHHLPVTYVLFPDEGHGFHRPENTIAFTAIAEEFLAKVLNGRAEPIGNALEPSSAEILDGAAFVPGLEAAISTKNK